MILFYCKIPDRPKLVCNRCVIEVLVAFLCCQCCFLDISAGVVAFVIGLSQISSFFRILGRNRF